MLPAQATCLTRVRTVALSSLKQGDGVVQAFTLPRSPASLLSIVFLPRRIQLAFCYLTKWHSGSSSNFAKPITAPKRPVSALDSTVSRVLGATVPPSSPRSSSTVLVCAWGRWHQTQISPAAICCTFRSLHCARTRVTLPRYSEHIIYDVARCRLKFLLLVKFVYND